MNKENYNLNLSSILNDLNIQTPNRNILGSKYLLESSLNESKESSFIKQYLTQSNGVVEIKDLTDINELTNRFNNEEKSINCICRYYISLKSVFDQVDIRVQNLLLDYVSRFNNSCKAFNNKKTTEALAQKKYSDENNRLNEDLNQKKEDLEKIINNHRIEIEEIKKKYKNEIEEYKQKSYRDEGQIQNMKKEIERLKLKIEQNKNEIAELKEISSDPNDKISPDYTTITYYLGAPFKDLNINLNCPKKKEMEIISSKFSIAENNFNTYVNYLVETTNRTVEQYKNIYLKVKGKEFPPNNILMRHNVQAYNLNQELCWTNIKNIHQTLNYVIDEIFELINPKREVDPRRLNEDSCEFLLKYILGLKKLFFMQKQILERTFSVGDTFENKNKNLEEFKRVTKDTQQFFDENEKILNNQTFYERFKEELKEEKTEILSIDEYLKNIKSVLAQAKSISERQDNEYKEYIKNLKEQNMINMSNDIEIEIEKSTTKNKGLENNNINGKN